MFMFFPRPSCKIALVALGYTILVLSCAYRDTSLPLQNRSRNWSMSRRLVYEDAPNETLTLGNYTLIGTHGSAAYSIDSSVLVNNRNRGFSISPLFSGLFDGIIQRWAKNQHYDLYSQLQMGARYIHLEVCVHQGQWVTLHRYLARPVLQDIQQVNLFLKGSRRANKTKAFVLIHLERFGLLCTDANNQTITQFVLSLDNSISLKQVYTDTVISSLYGRGVIVSQRAAASFFPSDYVSDLKIFRNNRLVNKFPQPSINNSLNVFQWIMTPNLIDIMNNLFIPYPFSGLHLFESVNDGRFRTEYVRRNRIPLKDSFEIFMVDHLDPCMSSQIDSILNTNQSADFAVVLDILHDGGPRQGLI